jgi:protein-L-isoaspartate(D-aspartate) O-methyltransferase
MLLTCGPGLGNERAKRRAAAILGVVALVTASAAADAADDPFRSKRLAMVTTIREMPAPAVVDPAVLDAMLAVPRHEFVPQNVRADAYADRPLPIGYGQTISQPYIVALMSDLAQVEPGQRVLEIGTGSGYQAAILAALGAEVRTIEIVPELADTAAARLEQLGYDAVEVRQGDGYYGWPEDAPFDSILVTAAAGSIPPPLIQQLRPGGRMIIPVGPPFMTQQLTLVEKDATGAVRTQALLPVSFVPFTRGG